ncbi:MAG: hypothetical protein L0Y54_13595 [Sporichthyaceae bacterium]|nr:hypothetical protein [Sporichthyaceae bacterium]
MSEQPEQDSGPPAEEHDLPAAGPDRPDEPNWPNDPNRPDDGEDDLSPHERTVPTGDPDVPLPEPPETGDERVDDALTELAEITGQPPAEHVAVFERVHRRLQDTLADLDGS